MRRIIASIFVSLDGVMQAPGGPDEDPIGGFVHGGWAYYPWDDESGAAHSETFFSGPFDLLLGRKTYDIFAAHWPYAPSSDPIAVVFNRATKYVATHSHDDLDWENSRSLGSDVVTAIKDLKAEDGPPLLVQGSSVLLQTLLTHGLIDELQLLVFPVILGMGKRLFGAGTVAGAMALTSSRAFPNGIVISRYRPAGPLRCGSFALIEPSPAETARRRALT